MNFNENGRIIKGVGGLYTVKLNAGDTPLSGKTVLCRARGSFRHDRISPLPGDIVTLSYSDISFEEVDGNIIPSPDGTDILMSEILERRNSLIRPPLANLDYCFVTMASARPEPMTNMTDKLISILEFNHVEPVVVIGKSELNPGRAAELEHIYRLAGFDVFVVSCFEDTGIDTLRQFIVEKLPHKLAAFSGASGVGKSTLLNKLFPNLSLTTSDISRRISRGKQTTRTVELFPLEPSDDTGYIADTPGFSMLDFERFDFFTKDDLPLTFREFSPYLGTCKYTKCMHTKEDSCSILNAVKNGDISASRHDSFVMLYDILKNKHPWDK